MAQLQLGVPLKTREAVVQGPRDLPVGKYRVVLVVTGRSGESAPVELRLSVLRSRLQPVDPVVLGPLRPTDVLRPVEPVQPVGPLRPVDPLRPPVPVPPVVPVRPVRPGRPT